jgi:hypothetical protein
MTVESERVQIERAAAKFPETFAKGTPEELQREVTA